jgi:hypothetical protein
VPVVAVDERTVHVEQDSLPQAMSSADGGGVSGANRANALSFRSGRVSDQRRRALRRMLNR